MKVSVVIPTKNSKQFIDRVLVNLLNQNYSNMELIIVDNFSTDSTRKKSLRFVDKFLTCGPERTAQANYGIARAKGELIYLTGSDMTRDYDFISKCVDKINEGYDAIYMSVLTDMDVKHFWGRVKALERKSYIGTQKESARFFKKEVWERLGGFDDELISMEEDFQHRLDDNGFKTGWIDAREYHLHEETNLRGIFRKAYYYGKYLRGYIIKHNKTSARQLNPIRSEFRVFLKHPILLVGLIIYKLVQYLGGALGLFLGR